jgi:hypothetical protein
MRTAFRRDFLLVVVGAVAGWMGHLVLANAKLQAPTRGISAWKSPVMPARPGAAPRQIAAPSDRRCDRQTAFCALHATGADAGSIRRFHTNDLVTNSFGRSESRIPLQADATDRARKRATI